MTALTTEAEVGVSRALRAAAAQASPQFDGSQKLSSVVAVAVVVTFVVPVPLHAVTVWQVVVVLVPTVEESAPEKTVVKRTTVFVHEVKVLLVHVADVDVSLGDSDGVGSSGGEGSSGGPSLTGSFLGSSPGGQTPIVMPRILMHGR